MSDAPLHPRRLIETLHWLRDPNLSPSLPPEHFETIKIALKLILNSQQRVGITPEVADLGKNVLGVLDYVKKGITGR